jgi:hypothetical protein
MPQAAQYQQGASCIALVCLAKMHCTGLFSEEQLEACSHHKENDRFTDEQLAAKTSNKYPASSI